MKGIALMQKTKFEANGQPINLRLKIHQNFKNPAFNIQIVE
jgi:hypothetical protein